MALLRSSQTTNPKTVVITVNLPEDKSLLSPRDVSDLNSITKSWKRAEKTPLSKYNLFRLLNNLYDSTKDDQTSSESSLSSRDMDSLNEDFESHFADTENIDGSYSLSGLDDRDDILNMKIDVASGTRDNDERDEDQNVRDKQIEEQSEVQTTSSNIKFEPNERFPNSSLVTRSKTIKEVRRTASNCSRDYIHVFHNQLTTLVESSSEDSDDDDTSFLSSLDEDIMRRRWKYSVEAMEKRGLTN